MSFFLNYNIYYEQCQYDIQKIRKKRKSHNEYLDNSAISVYNIHKSRIYIGDDMLEKIITLLNQLLEDSQIEPITEESVNTPLSDLGFDSLKFIQFVLLIEETCGIEILDSDLLMENFATVDQILQTLEKYEL